MTVPKPRALGLPAHIDSWRPNQIEALEFMARSTKRVKALSVPTGGGKSAIVIADALLSGQPTAIVTDSRALQDQYLREFNTVGMVDLRGRVNYDCGLRPEDPDYSCDQGYASRCPYRGTVTCPASKAEMRAGASSLIVTNYDKWIHTRRFGIGLSHVTRVVFDEGHEIVNALARAMQVTLHHREVEEVLGVSFPDPFEAQEFANWKRWAVEAREECQELEKAAKAAIQVSNPLGAWVKHYMHLRNLTRRLTILSTANPKNWVVEELEKGYQFDPVQPARYAETALLLQVPDITVVSATLRPKTLYMSGIGKVNFDYMEFDSDFDPRRCPTYYVPTMRVDARAESLDALWIRLDQIAARRRDRNGIVHTISYIRQQEVVARSRFAQSMICNEKGDPATWMVEQFKQTYPGAILVSPSVGQGFDFKGKFAEWQLICKIPFPPPSKVLKARTEADKEYPYYLAMQKLVQMVGRIMRDKEDQGESVICDDHMTWFYPRYRHLAPRAFRQFFTEVAVLPQPPRRLQ